MYHFIFLHITFLLSVADQWGTMRGNFRRNQMGLGTNIEEPNFKAMSDSSRGFSGAQEANAIPCFVCVDQLCKAQPVNNRFGSSQTRRNQCHEVFQGCVKFGSHTSDEWFPFGAGYTFLANDGWKQVHLLPSSWHLKLQMTRKRLQKEHFSAFNRDHQLSPHSKGKIIFYLGTFKYNVLGGRSAQTGQGWWDVHKDPAMGGFSLHSPVTNPPEFCSMLPIQNQHFINNEGNN